MKKITNNLLPILFILQTGLFVGAFMTLLKLNSSVTKLDWSSHQSISAATFILGVTYIISAVLFLVAWVTNKSNKKNALKTMNENDSSKSKKEGAENEERKQADLKNIERKNRLQELLTKEKGHLNIHETFIRFIATELLGCQAAFFVTKIIDNKKVLYWNSGYAFYVPESKPLIYDFGEGITGQVAKDKKLVNLKNATINLNPIISGLGKTNPENIIICPVLDKEDVYGIIEVASFSPFSDHDEAFVLEAATMLINSMNK